MDEKNRDYTKELDELAEQFDNNIVDELKIAVCKIKDFYQITDADLAELLDVDKSYLDGLFDGETAALEIDLRTIGILTLLSNGKLNVLTDTPTGEQYNKVNRIMKDFHDERYPEVNEDITDKVLGILSLFGVKTEEDLDHLFNAVKEVRGAINEYDKCNCEKKVIGGHAIEPHCKKECDQNDNVKYVDDNGNFQDCSKKNCEETKVKGSYYDSEKMDKPEQFEFTGSFDKLLPNFVNFLNKFF